MPLLAKGRPLAITTAFIGGLALIAPSTASAHQSHRPHQLAVQQVNLVSDQKGKAPLQDDDLVNPWGLSLGVGTPLWVSNNGTSTSTLYSAAPGANTATKVPTVRVTMDDPTGQVNNPGNGFVLSNGTTSAPARFIFALEGGQIAAWSPQVDALKGPAEIKATVKGAVYKGLAIATTRSGDRLYAANFKQRRIDVFDSKFMLVNKPHWAFRDARLPKGFAPFNVQTLKGRIFVTYAKVSAKDPGEEQAGRGLGFVDVYTVDGKFINRVASRGTLNAPWGLAFTPPAWHQPRGTLLVGNFGDGRINIFQPKSHGGYKFAGQVRNTKGKTLVIDGLWALLQGSDTTGGTNVLWFSAGPDDEAHGLLGQLRHP